jgi:hypothetical protein
MRTQLGTNEIVHVDVHAPLGRFQVFVDKVLQPLLLDAARR